MSDPGERLQALMAMLRPGRAEANHEASLSDLADRYLPGGRAAPLEYLSPWGFGREWGYSYPPVSNTWTPNRPRQPIYAGVGEPSQGPDSESEARLRALLEMSRLR